MLYEIGEKVKIREDLQRNIAYHMLNERTLEPIGNRVRAAGHHMLRLAGETFEISWITSKGFYMLGNMPYLFTDEMFDNSGVFVCVDLEVQTDEQVIADPDLESLFLDIK